MSGQAAVTWGAGSSQFRLVHSDSDRLEIAAIYGPGGKPPPPHLHPHHDERFTVHSGILTVERNGQVDSFGDGQSFSVPRGTTHSMWNAADEPAQVTWLNLPAGRCESWFLGVKHLLEQAEASGRKRPDKLSFAAHALRHRDVYRPVVKGSALLGSATVVVLGSAGVVKSALRR